MHILSETLDDALLELYPKLLASESSISTSRGPTKELLGVQIELENPRSRLSRTETRGKPFSALGEFLWYISGSDQLDFISYYIKKYEDESEDKLTVHGAYGPRFFRQRGIDQIANVVRLLKRRPTTRRAVIQLFNAEDIASAHQEIPCTTSLQFLIRDNKLDMIVTMRSNDAYLGLPHDIFCFTMLQEVFCRRLGYGLGRYRHFVASMHIYEEHEENINSFIDEGLQARIAMPSMPKGDQRKHLVKLLDAERLIRTNTPFELDNYADDDYWKDLVRLLIAFSASGDTIKLNEIMATVAHSPYRTYISQRASAKPKPPFELRQGILEI